MTDASLLQDSQTMAFDVFISYSTRNKLIADAMKQYLQSKGIRCWKAPDDIVHGESWAAAIPRAIKNSQIMVLIWTTDSMNSRQVVNELTLADRAKKMIIPFRTEPIEPENEFEYYLAKTHWFDAFGSDNNEDFELLSERVLRNLDESARPSRPLQSTSKDSPANSSDQRGARPMVSSEEADDHHHADVDKSSPIQSFESIRHLEISRSPLQGDELLIKIKEMGDVSKSELVRGCGYGSTSNEGTEILNHSDFYEALLRAKGFEVSESQPEEAEVINLHEDARANIEEGDYHSAIEKLDLAISIASKSDLPDPDIYYDRAVALSNSSRNQEALCDLTLAIEMSEEPEALYYRLRGIVHEELGDLALACSDWRVAAELGDTDSSEWFDTQCSCGQESVDLDQAPGEYFLHAGSDLQQLTESRAQEAAEALVGGDGQKHEHPTSLENHDTWGNDLASSKSEQNSLDDVERRVANILQEADRLTSESTISGKSPIRTDSFYGFNKSRQDALLRNHSIEQKSRFIYLFVNTGLLREKNGLLIANSTVSIKDFWEKPLHFAYYCKDEGLLVAEIEATDQLIKIDMLRKHGESAPSLVKSTTLDVHNVGLDNDSCKKFLEQRIPELIRLIGLREMQRCGSS
jgi:tetratricopeptide (TPR) repeat protein